jgi:hypothetical protein
MALRRKSMNKPKSAAKKKTRKPIARKRKAATKKIKHPIAVSETKEILPPAKQSMTESKIIEAFDAMGIMAKLDEPQKKLFIAVAREFQLNPLRREIHAVRMGGDGEESGGTLVPVVGYEVYIDRAEATGRLEYWYLEETGEIDPADWRKSSYRVTLVLKRRDWPKEFRWTVRYIESVGLKYNKTKGGYEPNSMWRKRGHFMTQKCTIGQGFRMVFREILRGMPYVDAEIENAENGEVQEREREELRPPRILPATSASGGIPPRMGISDPIAAITDNTESAIQIIEGQPGKSAFNPYSEIMANLNMTVKSKEGPMIALFTTQEKKDWKVKADIAREKLEELKDILRELDETAESRSEIIRSAI